ncbi:hypothetical protein J4573_40650 [Actinomadura barringtoniae]|uniref:Uncharacterized protein n=1 Tax=Actinomadura barringtoniae TaxID=1427535 RepID=A0A939TEK7_9ACTN|nr:hypothetical protein [Actinomadura barringtoniae]MBO2453460.1 hypothetical protein [Actinomadura barringtoniae]
MRYLRAAAGNAALIWSSAYGLLGLGWALGLGGFPYGLGDPDRGTVLADLGPGAGGSVIAVLGVLGVVAAVAADRSGSRPLRNGVSVFGGVMAVVLILVVPDARLVQNLVYGLFGYFGKLTWPVVNQLVCVGGGLAWTVTALVCRRRTRGACTRCGREATAAGWTTPSAAARWGRWATYAAMVVPLPYPVARLVEAIGIPLGFTDTADQEPVTLALMMTFLAFLAFGGIALTFGLVRPWGEIFPRWIPYLRGRRVPVAAAVVPATAAAVLMFTAGLSFGLGFVEHGGRAPLWQQWTVSLSWTSWGIFLGAAALAYHLRRRGPCRRCGRG